MRAAQQRSGIFAMNDKVSIHGIILSALPAGEADRKLVILSGEMGRVTAFARGARRPNSPLVAARPYTYGEYSIYRTRNYNVLDGMEGARFFDGLTRDFDTSCLAGYFAEFADYYAREGLEAKAEVRLLYAALSAVSKGVIPQTLIRRVFELRLMAINGEYSQQPFAPCAQAASYAWSYVLSSPVEKLFSFTLEENAASEFAAAVEKLRVHYIDRKFRSLELLDTGE